MGVTTDKINKPFNPRGNDQSPLAYNKAALYSGKALDFDGVNDYITTSLALTSDEVSVSFYLKWDDVGTQNIGFICEGSANDKMMIHTGAGGAGVNGFQIAINVTNYSIPQIISEGWNHYLITSDRINLNIYKNGVLFDSKTTDAGAVNITAFTLGIRPIGNAYAFDGQLSGFKVFNTALTAAQVADLYNNPEKVVPTGVDNTALKLWLPMMEGAGTTAYDGSGNGNHGTISGATYAHGIGAPVAQSAVIDWNKGSNIYKFSEKLNETDWATQGVSVSTDNATAPNGTTTAEKVTPNTTNVFHLINQSFSVTNGISYRVSLFAKAAGYNFLLPNTTGGSAQGNAGPIVDLSNGTIAGNHNYNYGASVTDAGNGWYKIEYDFTTNSSSARIDFNQFPTASVASYSGNGSDGVYIWGASLRPASSGSSYIPTIGTAQTSDVLLPQGLTTGRDITGVNLFENVRKQGALNLDGNSWAEVHDNESLDMTTTATMEAWVNADGLDGGYDIIMVKSSSTFWTGNYGRYTLRANEANVNWWFDDYTSNSKTYGISLNGYNHLVVTKYGTEEKLYINGALVSTQTGAATFTASPYSLLIGVNSSKTENWENQIAQPRIYNRALTAEEVQRSYDSNKNTYTNS